jgi:molybdopterin converting factor subunit 1
MTVRVLFFAEARERVGRGERTVELEPTATVAELCGYLTKQYPRLGEILPRCQIARNGVVAAASERLHEGDECAILPPVSGG